MAEPILPEVRLDKWLKVARFYKKREDAVDAVESGAVKLNGERTKPAKLLKTGDRLTIRQGTQYRDYIVKTITTRTLSAKLAKDLYEMENPPDWTPEKEEMVQRIETQVKENRKKWKKAKDNKKSKRDIRSFKYDQPS